MAENSTSAPEGPESGMNAPHRRRWLAILVLLLPVVGLLWVIGGSVSERGMRSLTEISTLSDVTLHLVNFSGDPFRPLLEHRNIHRLDLRGSTVTEDMFQSLN